MGFSIRYNILIKVQFLVRNNDINLTSIYLKLLYLNWQKIITLSDLECDFINPSTCCKKLNKMVFPEIFALTSASLLYLCTSHWFMFAFLSPLTLWTLYKFFTVPSSNAGVYDPIEIYSHRVLSEFMKESIAKTTYYLLWFFASLYNLSTLVSVEFSVD